VASADDAWLGDPCVLGKENGMRGSEGENIDRQENEGRDEELETGRAKRVRG